MPQCFTNEEGGSGEIGETWQRKADETPMAEYVA